MLAVCMALIDDEEDKKAFEKLYYEYRNLMMFIAKKELNDESAAEDAVSEAFLRIAKNFQNIHKSKCPKTAAFYVKIVRNVCVDLRRKMTTENALETYEDIPDEKYNDYSVNELLHCINDLKQSDRDILHLHYIYGYEIKTIAKMYGTKESAVYKRLARAKSHLLDELEGKHEQ